ncbi:MAG: hypothetical protein KTR32_05760 [Granulosicoccus sp.]|nr:hypothetical protein [Granulosicoccus sp.]
MNTYTDHALSAGAAFVYLMSIALAALATPVVLYLYRRALVRNQRLAAEAYEESESHSNTDEALGNDTHTAHKVSLSYVQLEEKPLEKEAYRKVQKKLDAKMRLKLAAYSLGGVAYSAVFTWAVMHYSISEPDHLFTYFVVFLFPFFIVSCLIYSTSLAKTMWILLSYCLLLVLSIRLFEPNLIVGFESLSYDFDLSFKIFKAVSILVLPAGIFFLNRRVRSIGFMSAFYFLVVLAGAYGVRHIFNLENKLSEWLNISVGLDFFLNLLLLVPLFLLVGWAAVKYLSGLYVRKSISDEKLMIDVIVFTFAVGHSVYLITKTTQWLLIGLFGFLAYLLVTNLMFILIARRHSNNQLSPVPLLYLRVFDLRKRGERFFNRFSKRWRSLGCINLISGIDLVKSTVEPDEFFDFVRGRMGSNFIKSKEDLAQRISRLDVSADYDSRYRINEFFCHGNTWKPTMQQLVHASDVVLMDLRSFNDENQGCLYELEQLVGFHDIGALLLLVDTTTDTDFLQNELQKIWRNLNVRSPNYNKPNASIHTFLYKERFTSASLRKLEAFLIAAQSRDRPHAKSEIFKTSSPQAVSI